MAFYIEQKYYNTKQIARLTSKPGERCDTDEYDHYIDTVEDNTIECLKDWLAMYTNVPGDMQIDLANELYIGDWVDITKYI